MLQFAKERSISGFIHAAVTLTLENSKTRVPLIVVRHPNRQSIVLDKLKSILLETTGFVLPVAEGFVQLTRVVKRHIEMCTMLHEKTTLIESKVSRSCTVLEELSNLIEVPGIQSVLFAQTLKDLNDIQQNLISFLRQIKKSGCLRRFLQAPVLCKSLVEIDTKLTQLGHFFRTISILGSTILSIQSDLRALVLAELASPESMLKSSEHVQQFLQNVELQVGALPRIRDDSIMKNEARIAFAMGLTIYGDRIGKSNRAFEELHPDDFHRAARLFRKACRLGTKEAYRHLGDLYYEGHGVEVCYRTAVEFYRKGAARNDAAAIFKLGWCYEFGHGVDRDGLQCVKYFREAMEEGSCEAMRVLGYFKLNGMKIPCDHSGAYQLLKKAEKKNVILAKASLAICYEKGIGEDRDPVKAFQLYRECFDGGCFLTTARLAHCYDVGIGVRRDPREATMVLERCMNSGTWYSDRFKAYLGLRLIQGNGVEKDVARGKAIIIDSTKSGNSHSWNVLGECFRHGIGFGRDIRKAKEFYEKAIDSDDGAPGVVAAYVAMGEIFEYGDGVTASIIQANTYYMRAANRLSSIGQWKVATAFEKGIGMKKNIHRAVHYFRLSANSGNVRAQQKSVTYYMKGHGVERPHGYIREFIEEAARGGREKAKKWKTIEGSNSDD